ncbi:S41 family peptidase [Cognatitamlana onchidii]|uniref:S41 family peptidase n=1 Tax=Cognatitamlana onchidii TaxID=2562860 RepID=UPI0010A61DBC|nr:S41 family peptidase [Algibacter onchidii]
MKSPIKLLAALFLISSVNFAQTTLINVPTLSPNGQSMAFNFQGDIWIADVNGKNPRRLTIHEAYDTNPLWSHDGKTIVFESDRYGNKDIFTIPASGGAVKRLTYHSAHDVASDVTSKGDVLFATRRYFAQVEKESEIFILKKNSGTPTRFMDALGYHAKLSPNGKFIAFTKGRCRLEREAYQGPANRDIWLYDITNDTYKQITTFAGNDFYPQWGNDSTLYFQSSRTGRYNVHKVSISETGAKDGIITAITDFQDMGLSSYHISREGNTLVMNKGDKVFKMNLNTNSLEEVKINIHSDYRFDPIVHKTYNSNVKDIALSPNGKYVALSIRGELFIRSTNKDKKRTVNVSNSAYRDRMPTWLNDSTLLFISDRAGQNDLYVVKSSDKEESNLFKTLKHEITRITETEEDESLPVLAANGRSIAYVRGRGELIVAKIDGNANLYDETVLLNGWDTPNGVSWSPDSNWLAYSLNDLDFNREVYIHSADNSKEPVNISMHPKRDTDPVWSPDGKKLMFSSNRNNNDYDVWFTWLSKEDWEKTKQDWEEEPDEKEDSKNKKDTENIKEKASVERIKIDFENIHERQVQVTAFVGGEFGKLFSKDSETIYYTTGNGSRGNAKVSSDLFKIKWDGRDKKAVTLNDTKPKNLVVNNDKSTVYFTKSEGSLSSIDLSKDKLENLAFTAKMNIDYNGESKQIFNEAWKAIRDGFYDPDFHGQDWNKLRQVYEPLALGASTRVDFQHMINRMLGQINASHMGLYRVETREDIQKESTGLLGVELELSSGEDLRVVNVIENMPASREVSQLMQGDIIKSVNGVILSKQTNIYSLLEGTSNEKIYINVERDGVSKEIVLRPKSSNRIENYKAWVSERKRLTDLYSGGKLGYIHIQGMNWESFERFERELTAAGLGKQGIVVDVRYNGGGWTTDYLMAVLNVKQHAYTIPRGATKNLKSDHTEFVNHYPFNERLPLASWTRPSIALCNESSYSNAEIFSHAYKALGIGTLVGVPTFGAVISTGSTSLIDGSYVRMPFRGWYVKETQSNMELGPAQPDILVHNNPDDKAKGRDTQLKRAVEELLKQL